MIQLHLLNGNSMQVNPAFVVAIETTNNKDEKTEWVVYLTTGYGVRTRDHHAVVMLIHAVEHGGETY